MASIAQKIPVNQTAVKLSEYDWAVRILMGIYLFLAPISIFFPPQFGVNSLRYLGAFVAVMALVSLAFPTSRISLRVWVLYALAFLYMLTLLSTDATTLAVNVKNTFSTIMFFVFLVLLIRKPCDNVIFWYYLLVFASVLAFFVSLGVRVGVISVPSYRQAVAVLFFLDRTAFVVDSSIGIWGLIASLYIVAETQGWKRRVGQVGIVASLGTVALGQFRSYLICCALILLIAFWFKSLKRIRLPLIAFAAASLVFVVLNPEAVTESAIWQRLQKLTVSTKSSELQWRTMEREAELKLISEKPLEGHGWRVAERHQIGSERAGKRAIYGHCLYTALPTRIGIPLAALFISSLFLLLFFAVKYVIKANSTSVRNLYLLSALAVFSMLLVSFVQNMPRGTTSFPAFAIFVWPLLRPLPALQQIKYAANRISGWRLTASRQNPGNHPI